MPSEYKKMAGIDVHKSILYVVIGDEEISSSAWKRKRFGASTSELSELSDWLASEQVSTVVMESKAQYWKPLLQYSTRISTIKVPTLRRRETS